MKKILFILLFLPVFVHAQLPLTFQDISGKWVERTRTDRNSDVAPFKDTLYLEIRPDGFMLIRHTIGSTFYGTAELIENKLTLENETFMVEGVENGILKLKQKKISHRFVKLEQFNDAPVVKSIPGAQAGKVINNEDNLVGKWSVYKKTDPNFTSKTFYLKMLDIKQMRNQNNFSGVASFHNMDSLYSIDAMIKVEDNELHIITDSKVLKAKILKSDGEEILLEHGCITYFMKRFNK